MRIAFINSSLGNYGPGIVMKDLCSWLVDNGHECKVFYFDKNDRELDFPCPTEQISFFKKIDFNEWDAVHSHTFRADGYIWWHNLLSKRTHFITTLHNPVSYKHIRVSRNAASALMYWVLWNIFITKQEKIIVLNEDTRKELKSSFLHKNRDIDIIFNGRDITIYSSITSNKEDAEAVGKLKEKYTVVGTVSGISRRKGLHQMIQALPCLPDYAFVAIGDGPELENLKNLAKELNVSDRCFFAGYRGDPLEYYSTFDIFVMCSYSEGFPLAIIESAAYGLPTVLSDIPILKSIISDTEVCFYRIDDIDSLVVNIKKANESRKEFSRAIIKYYQDNLTRDAMGRMYFEEYKKLSENK